MKTDSKIKQNVLDELKWEPSIDETKIGVKVSDGIITLSGNVPSYFQKIATEKATKKIYGVKAIVQEIEVKLESSSKHSDEVIAQAALHALQWDASIPEGNIVIKVENGWIYLEGELLWFYQKEAAKNAVQNLTGVKGIRNNITIKSIINSTGIQSNIENSFRRSASIDTQNIQVKTEDNKVILKGVVSSLEEKKNADIIAWSAPGVWSVENELTVEVPIII